MNPLVALTRAVATFQNLLITSIVQDSMLFNIGDLDVEYALENQGFFSSRGCGG